MVAIISGCPVDSKCHRCDGWSSRPRYGRAASAHGRSFLQQFYATGFCGFSQRSAARRPEFTAAAYAAHHLGFTGERLLISSSQPLNLTFYAAAFFAHGTRVRPMVQGEGGLRARIVSSRGLNGFSGIVIPKADFRGQGFIHFVIATGGFYISATSACSAARVLTGDIFARRVVIHDRRVDIIFRRI